MPQSRRRRRREPHASPAGEMPLHSAPSPSHRPPAKWQWRTFPVYFAFSLGAFIGVYAGVLSAWLSDEGESWMATSVFIVVAALLGLGLSRITSRWLVSRRFARARR